jgi:hypothetical protein
MLASLKQRAQPCKDDPIPRQARCMVKVTLHTDGGVGVLSPRDMQHGVSVLLDHGVRRLAELARFTGR